SHSDQFTIGFSVAGTIDLQSPLPDLKNSISIQGPGAGSLTVEEAPLTSFSSAIVTVDSGQTASLSGLTIANGNQGGIANQGTLTVKTCTITGNSSPFFGGGIFNDFGKLTVNDSTISGNTAGGKYNGGFFTFTTGGGIFTEGGSLTLTNS